MVLHRWVDPEFKDEEDMSREVEAGNGTGEEVEKDSVRRAKLVGIDAAVKFLHHAKQFSSVTAPEKPP